MSQHLNLMTLLKAQEFNKIVGRKMGRVKRESTFEHAQNAQIQIILRMRKIVFVFCSPFMHSVVSPVFASGQ